MQTKHTEEPWNLHRHYNGDPLVCESDGKCWTFGDWRLAKGDKILGDISFTIGAAMGWPRVESREECQANAERVVACVNGCAGIEYPAAINAAIEALHDFVEDEPMSCISSPSTVAPAVGCDCWACEKTRKGKLALEALGWSTS
jgi:hypothetical protein